MYQVVDLFTVDSALDVVRMTEILRIDFGLLRRID